MENVMSRRPNCKRNSKFSKIPTKLWMTNEIVTQLHKYVCTYISHLLAKHAYMRPHKWCVASCHFLSQSKCDLFLYCCLASSNPYKVTKKHQNPPSDWIEMQRPLYTTNTQTCLCNKLLVSAAFTQSARKTFFIHSSSS